MFLTLECGSLEAVSELIMERAFSPFIYCCDYFLGLRPRLIWLAPLALSNI
jgi:hypothetical protein